MTRRVGIWGSALLMISLMLTACGQKGALYLPSDTTQKNPAPTATVVDTPSAIAVEVPATVVDAPVAEDAPVITAEPAAAPVTGDDESEPSEH